ncbi:gluconolaconase [Mycolicibacterium insubricum]|uniref:SMP-30/gluconolactonase/LRE family protein n=1 Tax=Mycolicibacterium insubricum TaxID=444597 RepID=UPI000DA2570B|nr:SMP-30/gluconolactonase/LRE family protein [Mycolicibacterium insubricum]BBZ65258.1 gluconolaconase [Mycolicibacterium insubricum]
MSRGSTTRYPNTVPSSTAFGWTLHRLTPPSRVFGANGLRTGPDGRVYIAQVTGSQVSALDIDAGTVEAISPKGGGIVGPDDVAFDDAGRLIATEVMNGRVSMLDGGVTRVLRDDVPSANGITVHRGRLFVGECRPGGRLLELDLAGGAPRVICENLPSPNAMEFGPDGLLYFPVMDANEIWRIDVDGDSGPQTVAGGLGVPDSVKFGPDGQIVSTQVFSGQVLQIDPQTGSQTLLAQLSPGLDNCTLVGDRLFVSNFTGEITEIGADGGVRTALPGGLNWPLDLAVGDDGALYVADGTFTYRLSTGSPGDKGEKEIAGMLFTPGYPGFLRGLTPAGPGQFLVTTANGDVARWRPATSETEVLASGFDQLYGVALAPDGAALAVEQGTGRVLAVRDGDTEILADGLDTPVGIAITPVGEVLVSESGAGRVVTVAGGRSRPLIEGLVQPQGLLVRDGTVYVVDAGSKEVIAVDLAEGTRSVIAAGLPVGAPTGVTPKPLLGMPPFSGPQGPFAGIAAGADGTLFVSADADGSVLALRPDKPRP